MSADSPTESCSFVTCLSHRGRVTCDEARMLSRHSVIVDERLASVGARDGRVSQVDRGWLAIKPSAAGDTTPPPATTDFRPRNAIPDATLPGSCRH